MKNKIIKIICTVLVLISFPTIILAKIPERNDDKRKIAILALGDSLTAGMQDATNLAATQMNSWISLLAQQAAAQHAVHFANPWLNVNGERTNGGEYPTNISIPGLEVEEVLEATGVISLIDGVPIDMTPYLTPINPSGPYCD